MQSADILTIAIIGTSPQGILGPVRVKSFKAFKRHIGELEQAPPQGFLAANAAVHAFMNGAQSILFSGLQNGDLEAALQRLAKNHPAAIVAPELSPEESLSLLAACRRTLGPKPVLVFSPPERASVKQMIACSQGTQKDSQVVWVAPAIVTTSPGRRAPEVLPASTLAAPSILGMASTLRGVHELSRDFNYDQRERLKEAGYGLFEAHGKRRVLSLRMRRPNPRYEAPIEDAGPIGLEAELAAQIEAACALVDLDRAPNIALLKQLERRAKVALEPFVHDGLIERFVVHAEFEVDNPSIVVMEVGFWRAQRVHQLVLRAVQLGQ